jgi:hypothetical protein
MHAWIDKTLHATTVLMKPLIVATILLVVVTTDLDFTHAVSFTEWGAPANATTKGMVDLDWDE